VIDGTSRYKEVIEKPMRKILILLTAACSSAFAANQYVQHNFVSDLKGLADRTDPNLVNPWGIAASPTSPLWIANNHSGTATIYNGSGEPFPAAKPLVVKIPAPPGGTPPAAPSGQVFNEAGKGFEAAPGKPSVFLFSTEDGTISGWNPQANNGNAVVLIDHSGSGAVYKGLAYAQASSGPQLYAANFNSGNVEVYDANLNQLLLPRGFKDLSIPAGFAPFGIQTLNGKLYVTFAKQNDMKHDDVAGAGNGFIDVFDLNGVLITHLVSGGLLNSPWGLAIGSANFGDFANVLLVGNFGDGKINAYDPSTGVPMGTLADATGKALTIQGLWGLRFGNGSNGADTNELYFTAGISGNAGEAIESHGLFGAIQAAPLVTSNSFVNGASFQPGLAPNTWMSIVGSNLSATTRGWQNSDFVNGALPTKLDGVSVTVNGQPAYVEFVSPAQLNVLLPVNTAPGPAQVVVSNNGLSAAAVSVPMETFAPAFFLLNGKYIAATHADGVSLVGPTTLFPGSSTPAKPGETIVLYGTGFGPTNPATPDGQLVNTPANLVSNPTVLFGGAQADVSFAGLTATGLYQINLKVPASIAASGDIPVIAQLGGTASPATSMISVTVPQVTPPPPSPGSYAETINNFAFTPTPLTITAGSKVTWTNQQQGVPHTVVSDAGTFSSPVISDGKTYSVTLNTPGTYTYHCSIHPFMTAEITVK
jgi:uncharacterized protein (TIGR03118 family)